MRVAKITKGRYWGIFRTVSLVADGRKYHRQELVISLKGYVTEEGARALLRDLEEGKAEVCKDGFGHKYVHYRDQDDKEV